MLHLLADGDIHGAIVRGLLLHRPSLDLLRRGAGIGEVIASVLLLDDCSAHAEWRDKVTFIPL